MSNLSEKNFLGFWTAVICLWCSVICSDDIKTWRTTSDLAGVKTLRNLPLKSPDLEVSSCILTCVGRTNLHDQLFTPIKCKKWIMFFVYIKQIRRMKRQWARKHLGSASKRTKALRQDTLNRKSNDSTHHLGRPFWHATLIQDINEDRVHIDSGCVISNDQEWHYNDCEETF